MDVGEAISRLHQIFVYDKMVRLDGTANPLIIVREKLVTVIIILILPLFAECTFQNTFCGFNSPV